MIMKTYFTVALILGLAPLFLKAQTKQSKTSERVREVIATVQEIEASFDNHRRNSRSVTFYAEADFCGRNFLLTSDWSVRNKWDYWNDEIASIEVPKGWEVRLYEHANFRGEVLTISRDWSVRDNPWWRNRISSVRLVPALYRDRPHERRAPRCDHWPCHCSKQGAGVTLYEKKDFSGASKTIHGDWSVRPSGDFWNDRISSIHIPAGYEVIVYKHAHFQGRSIRLKGPWPFRRHRDFWDDWDDEISSIEVLRSR